VLLSLYSEINKKSKATSLERSNNRGYGASNYESSQIEDNITSANPDDNDTSYSPTRKVLEP
jgi:hypothetical protein